MISHNLKTAHFTDEEKRVLRLVVSLTRTPSDVCDELYGELRRRFSERELVELNAAICWENYRARFNRTFAGESGGSQTACSTPCQRNDLGIAIGLQEYDTARVEQCIQCVDRPTCAFLLSDRERRKNGN